ncbi:uncharacterized protein LOC132191108 [Corylus avellana]|uniref:uncharacterized protein LOC132191108 n=1 Tax=Corylus avellana TaxID=13451 RepID=UPI00286A5361|nr:uncharacterized protein LOC132191108 [Corylus avellana]
MPITWLWRRWRKRKLAVRITSYHAIYGRKSGISGVPESLNFFLWKACNDILPTKEKLFKRKVVPDPLCPICMSAPESISHILWTCPSAQDVWAECNGKLQKSVCIDGDFIEILLKVGQGLDEDERHLMVTVARSIWLRRNKLVFEGIFQAPATVVRSAREQVEALDNVTRRHSVPSPRSIAREEVVWKKPPQGMVKINWDRGKIGMGAIVRDHSGKVIAMTSGPREFVNDPSLVEALAAREAVDLSISLGFQNCILEGDELELINAITQDEPCRGTYGQIVNDIKFLLLQGGHWKVSHTRRAANGTAHLLAKMGLLLLVSQIWTSDFPPCLDDIVRTEQSF